MLCLVLKLTRYSPWRQVSAEDWDACATGDGTLNPFLLHSFLLALETSQSAVRHYLRSAFPRADANQHFGHEQHQTFAVPGPSRARTRC